MFFNTERGKLLFPPVNFFTQIPYYFFISCITLVIAVSFFIKDFDFSFEAIFLFLLNFFWSIFLMILFFAVLFSLRRPEMLVFEKGILFGPEKSPLAFLRKRSFFKTSEISKIEFVVLKEQHHDEIFGRINLTTAGGKIFSVETYAVFKSEGIYADEKPCKTILDGKLVSALTQLGFTQKNFVFERS